MDNFTLTFKKYTMNEGSPKFVHKTYAWNAVLNKNLVGKKVNIRTTNEHIYTGIVYTIDPVSESIVLLGTKKQTKETNHYTLTIIFGHALKNIKIISEEETTVFEIFSTSTKKPCKVDLIERKNAVKRYFLENRFPVTEVNDVLCIQDSVYIKPPYEAENCTCTNSIILSRIRNLLHNIK